jgi:error-prone DNA polymerase
VVTAEALRTLPDRTVVEVGGIVTHRQQPETAKGVVFLNLEDETGLVNVICTADVWKRFRTVARGSPALVVRGMLERRYDVVNLVARRIEPLSLRAADLVRSRDFR